MGRAPCCSKVGLQRGPWTTQEDALLTNYIQCHGEGHWRSLPKNAGLLRCGKSCRLRWLNYLRPDIKRGNIDADEEDLIIRLHSLLGNRWSLIAGRIPGRTDNEIKNYWNSHLSKKLKKQGIQIRECTSSIPSRSKTSKTKNTSSKKKKKDKMVATEINEHIELPKIEVHVPKPTRFAIASDEAEKSQGSESSEEERGEMSKWSDLDSEGNDIFLERDDGLSSNIGVEFDFELDLLDRVYQEYSQLLMNSEDGMKESFPMVNFLHDYSLLD